MSDLQGNPALVRAIKVLKTQAAAAAAIGIKQQTVSGQLKSGNPVPAEWAIPLDIATAEAGERVSCHELRPDLWPEDFIPPQQVAA